MCIPEACKGFTGVLHIARLQIIIPGHQLHAKLIGIHGIRIDRCRHLGQRYSERNAARQLDLTQIHINGRRHWNTKLLQHIFCLLLDKSNSKTMSQSGNCPAGLHNQCINLSEKIYLLRPITSIVRSKMPV